MLHRLSLLHLKYQQVAHISRSVSEIGKNKNDVRRKFHHLFIRTGYSDKETNHISSRGEFASWCIMQGIRYLLFLE